MRENKNFNGGHVKQFIHKTGHCWNCMPRGLKYSAAIAIVTVMANSDDKNLK